MPLLLNLVICFVLAAMLVFFSIPTIIGISREKKLYDVPNSRKVNTNVVPTLGGVAIFMGFIIAVTVSSYQYPFIEFRYILTALTIMLFVGLKDDLMDISASSKFIGEFVAATIVCILGNIRFTDLHGLLGIHGLNPFFSISLSLLFIAFIINAINLIDGIDGLASGIGIVASATLGTWFYVSGNIDYSLMSFALVGALCSFFLYNVFGKSNKIFMGDTGSLILGLILSVLIIRFNELNIVGGKPGYVASSPSISLGIVIVPVIDTLRVMMLRIIHGRSPFKADRNHIHHKLLDLHFTHLQATLTLVGANLLFTVASFSLQNIGMHTLMLINVVIGFSLAFMPAIILKHRSRKMIVTGEEPILTQEEKEGMSEILRDTTQSTTLLKKSHEIKASVSHHNRNRNKKVMTN